MDGRAPPNVKRWLLDSLSEIYENAPPEGSTPEQSLLFYSNEALRLFFSRWNGRTYHDVSEEFRTKLEFEDSFVFEVHLLFLLHLLSVTFPLLNLPLLFLLSSPSSLFFIIFFFAFQLGGAIWQ